MIYLGADHRGFQLKEEIKSFWRKKNINLKIWAILLTIQMTTTPTLPNWWPKRCPRNRKKIKESLSAVPAWGGHCRQQIQRVRSALADDIQTAKQSREHDDTNVLSLPADEVNFELAKKL